MWYADMRLINDAAIHNFFRTSQRWLRDISFKSDIMHIQHREYMQQLVKKAHNKTSLKADATNND